MKTVKVILICVLSLAIVLYILFPAGFGLYASFRRTADVGLPPVGFGAVRFTAEDGVQLAAWYAPPENGAAILLLHGGMSASGQAALNLSALCCTMRRGLNSSTFVLHSQCYRMKKKIFWYKDHTCIFCI